MSTAVRLISGTAAQWARIMVMMISQLVLVPVFLSYWSAEEYGVWLAIQSLIFLLNLLDLGHHTYVGFELYRYARTNMVTFCKNLWSSVFVGFFASLLQLLIIIVLIYFAFVPFIVGESKTMDAEFLTQTGYVLFLAGVTWTTTASVAGFFVRALESFGHHARLSWWGVLHSIICAVAPAIAVAMGADFLQAGITLTVVSISCYLPIFFDMFRLMKREKIVFLKPSWRLGLKNLMMSTGVSGKLVLENLRQQGVRLVLAPISGASALAAFSTMRTGSNVALQGLYSITNPLMPDLMRFLHNRDQEKSEAGFGTIWVVVVALISPAVIVLQALAGPLFEMWTQGRITFDPTLFALMSLSVLLFAVAQPAIAVVTGNNILKPQLLLSAASATLVIALVVILVPLVGLVGSGIALVVAEVAATIGYVIAAKAWLSTNGLAWPRRAFTLACLSVVIAGTSMLLMGFLPDYAWYICGAGLLLSVWNSVMYWFTLPLSIRNRLRNMAATSKHRAHSALRKVIG